MRRPVRQLRRTVLVIVEGDTEFAFCRFLKAHLSRGRNLQVSIDNAHGGSPDKIVQFAQRQARQFPADQLAILFDTDLPLSAGSEKIIRQLRARAFRFTPCIEGFYLELLGHPKPNDTATCKDRFHHIGLDAQAKLSHESYAQLFPAERFDTLRQNREFEALVQLFSHGQSDLRS